MAQRDAMKIKAMPLFFTVFQKVGGYVKYVRCIPTVVDHLKVHFKQ